MTEQRCPTCGRLLDEHRRHLRFRLPQPVLEVPEGERAERTWGNDVLMQVREVGSFVRVLVPVRLTGGYTVTYGAWLFVRPEDLRHAWEVWWTPEYAQLRLAGLLANMLPAWESHTYGKPLAIAVRDPESAPYAVDSSDDFMRRVLQDEWPHEPILDAIARYWGSRE
ncbi:MAG TPA: DUF2199 domain-containing protein [Methylomirabilota bacterium]